MAPFSLKEITDAWGKWKAKQSKTGIKWTETTKYNNHGELGNYHQHECKVKYLETTYGENSKPPAIPVVVQESMQKNSTNTKQSIAFHYTAERSSTATWSVTDSLKIGVSVTVKGGLAEVAEVEETVTVERDLSTTETKSLETKRSWVLDTTIVVPKNSSVKTQVTVNERSVETPYKSLVEISGGVAVWFNNKINILNPSYGQHWLWFVPIEKVFTEVVQNNIISVEGYSITGGSVIATATGTFKGSVALSANISTEQFDLQGKPAAVLSAAMLSEDHPDLTTTSDAANNDQAAGNDHQE